MSRQPTRKIIIEESTGRRIIEQSRVRLLCIGLFFLLCFGSIVFRMIEISVLRHRPPPAAVVDPDREESSAEAAPGVPPAAFKRGDITDRNGQLLATSLPSASLFARPQEIRNPQETAKKLSRILGMDVASVSKRLTDGKSFAWIKRDLTPREQQAVNSLGIPGLYFQPEEKRVYPYGSLAAHAVGYVGIDDRGLAGAEKYFDRLLSDRGQNREPLRLSIDIRLQSILREEMKRAVGQFKALGGAGVILDIRSGELLSLVSLPDFDPHAPGKPGPAHFNRVSLGAYEMGSTFKSFTMAMAIESGAATMKSSYDATHPLKISSYVIRDAHPESRRLSVPEIFAYSSNIGTAKIALDVGGKRQKEFLKRFGMMEPVEIELPERATPLWPSDWKEISTVTISYGQGISISPLHLVRGIAALVNGGTLPRLTLVKDGNAARSESPRVISEKTSRDLRRLMRLAVGHGTGGKADVPGYRVGGKTGTAEKVRAGGGYDENAKLVSFVAAFPVDDPRYVMLVMIDEPRGDASTHGFATGGWISAPLAGNVIARMGPLLAMKPSFDTPGDDAERFWVGRDKPASIPVARPEGEAGYFHAVAY